MGRYKAIPVSSGQLPDEITIVTQENALSSLGGTIDSSTLYWVFGTVDCSAFSIEVPPTGIFIAGTYLDQSVLTTTGTLFVSPVGGSGNVFLSEITLSGNQVFDIFDHNGFNAVEFSRVNWSGLNSIGEISGYRQGLETGTGRFGGKPTLTLSGTWIGGYRITTSIVRNLDPTMNGSLFEEGTGFTMSSRFLTDINCDLPANASFCNFGKSNFTGPSLLQVRGAIFTRNGNSDASDTNIFPNIQAEATECSWKNNEGIPNTYVGGKVSVSSEAQTVIPSGSTWVDINAAAWSSSELAHFENPSAGQLKHVGNNPREFKVTANLNIDGPANFDLGVRFRKWDSSSSTWVNFPEQRRQVNNYVGGRDVAIFDLVSFITLDQNDFVVLQVRNNNGSNNLVCENSSFLMVEER